nr:Uncharacterised protein [Streptococcus thermophilus]
MADIPLITLTDKDRENLDRLAQFPLLDAINGRRSRRFPLGGHVPAGPLAYQSKHDIQPLSDLERAIILATVAGVTGWHHSITHHPGYAPKLPDYSGSAVGRTFPSAAGFHIADFFFTDESGTYALSTRDATPEVPFNENEGFTEARLNSVLRRVRKLSDDRLWIPREEPYLEGHNTWIANHPGSLLIAPVSDLAQHTLANLAFFTRNKYVIYDDINGREIPGIKEFGDIARVDDPLPLTFLEQYSQTEATAELMSSTLLGHLVLGALGLGGWSFDGIDRLTFLAAPGVRMSRASASTSKKMNAGRCRTPSARRTSSRPTARPITRRWPTLSTPSLSASTVRRPFHPDTPGPWTESRAIRSQAAKPDERFTELMKLQATYIWDTFGKFPGTIPTVWIMNYLQAQHLDTDYYDEIFNPGAYLSTHAEHQQRWH